MARSTSAPFCIRIPLDLVPTLEALARARGKTPVEYVRWAMVRSLETKRDGTTNPKPATPSQDADEPGPKPLVSRTKGPEIVPIPKKGAKKEP